MRSTAVASASPLQPSAKNASRLSKPHAHLRKYPPGSATITMRSGPHGYELATFHDAINFQTCISISRHCERFLAFVLHATVSPP
jgi:hypothetical protein